MASRALSGALLGILLFALLLGGGCRGPVVSSLEPYDLRCDAAIDPLGVDSAPPRLSWKLRAAGEARGERQTAWQVLVAGSREALARDRGELWDSGRRSGAEQLLVNYDGRALRSSERVFWKVRVWDASGRPSAWSAPSSWTMGVLGGADEWKASWIADPEHLRWVKEGSEKPLPGAARAAKPGECPLDNTTLLLRREFAVRPGLRRALAHVTGLGSYVLHINGRRVGEDLLSPGWTTPTKRVLYDTFDVTGLLRAGAPNAAGLVLAGGMYCVRPGRYVKFITPFRALTALCQLRLEYEDGSVATIGTDAAWRAAQGPTTFSNMFGGEDYDARREPKGWASAGFDDAAWRPAVVHAGPGGVLCGASHAAPPLRAVDVLPPPRVRALREGVAVYDFGQNTAFMPRLRVRGPAGSEVRLIPSELLKEDGSVNRRSAGGGDSWWSYTLAGKPEGEAWMPQFHYQGCRYLQVELRAPSGAQLPVVERLEGLVVHTSSAPVGDFACSNDLFNRVRTLIRWAQRSNLVSLISDCPHRERLGWLEQYHLNGPSLRYEFDLARLYRKTFDDMADAQLDNGLVPDIAPEYVVFNGGFRDSPEWGSAILLAAWQHLEWTGDDTPLRLHYGAMRRYVDYLGTRAKDGIVSHGLGDWYDLGPKPPGVSQLTPIPVTATATYYEDAKTLAAIARRLGRANDAEEHTRLAASIRAAFNAAFYREAEGSYATGSQCANAMALLFGLAPESERVRVFEALRRDFEGRGITAGDVGYRYVLRALADGGASEAIYRVNNQSERPGYGYQLARGCTSLAEAWDAGPSSSQNHFMLGQIMEWFYHDLAGLAPDPQAPGFGHVIVRPQPVGDLQWARASHESPRGRVAVAWRRSEGRFALEVELPPGATATVHVPTRAPAGVLEGGAPAAQGRPGVRLLGEKEGSAVFAVESGRYAFEAAAP